MSSYLPADLRPIPGPEEMERQWQDDEARDDRIDRLMAAVAALGPEGEDAFASECERLGAERTNAPGYDGPRAMLSRALQFGTETNEQFLAREPQVLADLEQWLATRP